MVSVNFRSNHLDAVTSPKESRKTKVTEKPVSRDAVKDKVPVCVIDVRQSPYRIVENYPDDEDVVDVCSDDEVCQSFTNCAFSNCSKKFKSFMSFSLVKHSSFFGSVMLTFW